MNYLLNFPKSIVIPITLVSFANIYIGVRELCITSSERKIIEDARAANKGHEKITKKVLEEYFVRKYT